MIIRIAVMLICVLIFVNSCNSFISGVAGTHKLRQFSVDEVKVNGLADADFVEISDVHTSGDYIFVPHRSETWPGFVEFPILDSSQRDSIASGEKVTIYLVGWTQKYEENCIDQGNCIVVSDQNIRGLVRPMNKRFDKTSEWPKDKYTLAEAPIFIEIDRQPLAWYWNLVMMFGAVGVAFGIESWLSRKEKEKEKEKE